ncbi:MAG: bacillithiol biosynthesis cysteine-adding enzyme BshC [Planctomycetota bacterium]
MFRSVDHLPADVLGLSPVARAALSGRPQPAGLPGMLIPARVEDIPRPPDLLDLDERAELADALESALTIRAPHVAVLDSLRNLRKSGTSMVIAGQQPAFLGGPLYNIYKAVHAIRLARALGEAWGTPVIPAFWNHADDHDIAEVHHLWLMNTNLDLYKLHLASMSSGRQRFGEIILDQELHKLTPTREALRQNLWQGNSAGGAVETFMPRSGETFSGAFTQLLLDLFGHHGLVVVEPDVIRNPMSSALADLVATDVHAALQEGSRALEGAGLSPAINPTEAALVFQHRGGQRHALRLASPDTYAFDDEPGSRTPSELAAAIVQDRANWSPGALLRPLVQDRVLPAAAYIGGWGELAYHAQLPPLRRASNLPLTPFIPRLSATLVDPESDAALVKLGVSAQTVLEHRGELNELFQDDTPEQPPVLDKLRAIANNASKELSGLRVELEALDRGLAAQLKRTGKQISMNIDKLVQKAERVHKNKQGHGTRHLRRLQSALFPRGQPQERVRGAIEFVARFGRDWIDQMIESSEPLPTEHLVVHLRDQQAQPGADSPPPEAEPNPPSTPPLTQ